MPVSCSPSIAGVVRPMRLRYISRPVLSWTARSGWSRARNWRRCSAPIVAHRPGIHRYRSSRPIDDATIRGDAPTAATGDPEPAPPTRTGSPGRDRDREPTDRHGARGGTGRNRRWTPRQRPEAGRLQRTLALDQARQILERHGGVVERSMSGVVIAVFGVRERDDGLRAIRAALELRAALSTMGDYHSRPGAQIAARVGVHTGEVVVEPDASGGDAGCWRRDRGRRPPRAGDRTGKSSSYRGNASPGSLGGRGHPIEPIRVSGRSKPLGAYRIVGAPSPGWIVVPPGSTPRSSAARGNSGSSRMPSSRRSPTRVAAPFSLIGRPVSESPAWSMSSRQCAELGGCRPWEVPAVGDGVAFWPLAEAIRGVQGRRSRQPRGGHREARRPGR